MVIHYFSYKKDRLCDYYYKICTYWLVNINMSLRRITCEKKFVSKESFVRHGRKNLLSLQQRPRVQASWNNDKMKNVFNELQIRN